MAVGLPAQWEQDILTDLGAPLSGANIAFLDAWQLREGGSTANTCDWNPLNTMQTEPGSHNCTPGGIQAYPGWSIGELATTATLEHYPAIVAMLKGGNPDPNFPGVASEFFRWSGGAYNWPGSGGGSVPTSPVGGGGSTPGGGSITGAGLPLTGGGTSGLVIVGIVIALVVGIVLLGAFL